eukprot:5277205-Prymnesium_polylepis.2
MWAPRAVRRPRAAAAPPRWWPAPPAWGARWPTPPAWGACSYAKSDGAGGGRPRQARQARCGLAVFSVSRGWSRTGGTRGPEHTNRQIANNGKEIATIIDSRPRRTHTRDNQSPHDA